MPGPTIHQTIEAVIAENARWLMQQRGLSQSEFARRMNALWLTAWRDEKVVRRFLRGERQLKPTELVAVALVLETTVQALMTPGLERWATERIGMGAVNIGPLTVFSGDVATLLADKDHMDKPLASRPKSGIEFVDDGAERDPVWRSRSMQARWRERVWRLLAAAYMPIPAGFEDATADELNEYAKTAEERIITMIREAKT
jgi:transcriptional regulator with XRE-family HTH domain